MSEGAQSPYDYSLSLEDFDAKSNGYNLSTYQGRFASRLRYIACMIPNNVSSSDKPDTYAEMDTRVCVLKSVLLSIEFVVTFATVFLDVPMYTSRLRVSWGWTLEY